MHTTFLYEENQWFVFFDISLLLKKTSDIWTVSLKSGSSNTLLIIDVGVFYVLFTIYLSFLTMLLLFGICLSLLLFYSLMFAWNWLLLFARLLLRATTKKERTMKKHTPMQQPIINLAHPVPLLEAAFLWN